MEDSIKKLIHNITELCKENRWYYKYYNNYSFDTVDINSGYAKFIKIRIKSSVYVDNIFIDIEKFNLNYHDEENGVHANNKVVRTRIYSGDTHIDEIENIIFIISNIENFT